MSLNSNHINYIEFPAPNLEKIKAFYTKVFNWKFTDYGPAYTSFSNSGVAGGFEKSEKEVVNGALVVLYHEDLEDIKKAVVAADGRISVDVFAFPGGRRFHFIDPAGNELAVWSEV